MIDFVNVKHNEIMARHCSMHVGGTAKLFFEPQSIDEFKKIIKFCRQEKIKYFILGNGTNVIFTDNGFDGAVVCTKKLNGIVIRKNILELESGLNLFVLNKFAMENGLSGMEWSYGIPGTIGGAVCMNAGAYLGEIKDIVLKVEVFDGRKTFVLYNNELSFEYRNSILKKQGYVVLRVWIKLSKSAREVVTKKSLDFLSKRMQSQPLGTFNSGSIFKKYKDISVGKLIDNLGLKGAKINGAEVSRVHANFIVNNGNAKCQDVLDLIKYLKFRIYQSYDIKVEEEVIVVGD